jgi:hypothetical protein
MLCRVLHAGWWYELEVPPESRLVLGGAEPLLVIGHEPGTVVGMAPRALVRAAKDHLLGLACCRSGPIVGSEPGGANVRRIELLGGPAAA